MPDSVFVLSVADSIEEGDKLAPYIVARSLKVAFDEARQYDNEENLDWRFKMHKDGCDYTFVACGTKSQYEITEVYVATDDI